MATFKIQAGAEIDLLTAPELKEQIDGLQAHMTKLALLGSDTVVRNPSQSGTVAADGTVTLNLGAPSARRRWDVRRVNITGVDIGTAEPGLAVIYRKSVEPARFVDFTSTIPNVSPWSANQFPLKFDEDLIVYVSGATAGAILIASAALIDSSDVSTLVVD